MLPFIILGLTSGSAYALGGLGLVMTYRISGVFNFAYGALASAAAFTFYALHDQAGLAWPLAAIVAVFGVGTLMGLLFEPLARALARVTLALQVGATVGVLLFIEGLFIVLYGQGESLFPPFLPSGATRILGTYVQWSQIVTVAIALLATVALALLFRRTRFGLSMRALVDNGELLELAGTSPNRVRRTAWIIGCILASTSGLLLAPSLSLSSSTLTLLIVQSFGAAAIGAFTSLPMTYVGGLVVGVAAALLTKYTLSNSPVLLGIPPSTPFLVLFFVLLAMPRRWLRTGQRTVPTRRPWSAPLRVQAPAFIAAVVLLAFLPALVGARLEVWTIGLAYVILFLSLGLLVRTSGQVSLGHLSFAAIGAAAFSHLTTSLGLPWLPALLCAGVVVVPVGVMLAVPAIRLGGIYLALATFGFAIALQDIFYGSGALMFGSAGAAEPRPTLGWLDLSSDKGFYYVVLGMTVLVAAVVIAINRSRLGRLLRALADSPLALETNGTNVVVLRVVVFAIAAYLAGIGGALLGATVQLADGELFDPFNSLVMVALVLIAVGGEPWFALIAAASQVLPSYVPGGDITYFLQMGFGVGAVAVAIRGTPSLSPRLQRILDGFGRPTPSNEAYSSPPPASGAVRVAEGALELRELRVCFGGVVALDRLSMQVPTGRITGLIGPNGAGKTTTFNACLGLIQPAQGSVWLDGRNISKDSPSRRARLGLGRTFQRIELFDSLTVAENAALGREANLAGSNPLRQVLSTRSDRRTVNRSVAEALAVCGLGGLANERVSSLSTGQRRLVELARCLAGPYRILLLDEPSSGLSESESEQFGRVLQDVVERVGVGILLVEHDMPLVMSICDYVYVLDFGVEVFHGSPREVATSPIVQAAYLGQPEEALEGQA